MTFYRWLSILAVCAGSIVFVPHAGAFDIPGPTNSVYFGKSVTVLPNGNIVIVDPGYAGMGAAYLYSPNGVKISTLTGSQGNDAIGSSGVVVLANGNYVVLSPNWHNGAGAAVGAATWRSASGGPSDVVSANNSLIGSTANDAIGSQVIPLTNGNYVVWNAFWTNSSTGAAKAGAVAWCKGDGLTKGVVSASNALVGTQVNDYVGWSVVALTNGNYVIGSPDWANGSAAQAGAATWGNGNGGTVGLATAANSLVGANYGDMVGSVITALSNGNYVVGSAGWAVGSKLQVGAATWGNGNGGTVGPVTPANSLVGTNYGDGVGSAVIALSNGNYVVGSPSWANGSVAGAGAVTWGNGTTGTVGAVSEVNSLFGSNAYDDVGYSLSALRNGDYVVGSPYWLNGTASWAGAATWGNGNGGTIGAVSAGNSLVGSSYHDQVGSSVIPLSNGNYVVAVPAWAGVGAVTWGGFGGTTGPVSASNSLIGATNGDQVGQNVAALSNGNYVVGSPLWSNGGTSHVGAVTWGNGNSGTVATVAPGNSLIGTTAGDEVGYSLLALSNGNYVAGTPFWTNNGAANAGAQTLGNGISGAVGVVTPNNSLVGITSGDRIGFDLTFNSPTAFALSNGGYALISPYWTNASISQAGAATLRRGTDSAGSIITVENSVMGLLTASGFSMSLAYDASRDVLIVGRPAENKVTVFAADLIFRSSFE